MRTTTVLGVSSLASIALPALPFCLDENQVYTSSLQADVSMASQLLSPCITVLLEGLQGESQDEVHYGRDGAWPTLLEVGGGRLTRSLP